MGLLQHGNSDAIQVSEEHQHTGFGWLYFSLKFHVLKFKIYKIRVK